MRALLSVTASTFAAIFLALMLYGTAIADSGTGSVSGIVSDPLGGPVPNATVTLSGASTLSATTDTAGSFSIANVPTGIYRVQIAKSGFSPSRQDDVAVLAGSVSTIAGTLQPLSIGSLTTIGRVSTSATGRINTSSAAVTELPAQTITDRGFFDLSHALDAIPGFVGTIDAGGYTGGFNGAVQQIGRVAQIRGALPYETESLIDGHPLAFGAVGFYNPAYLSPYMLQSIDVVKGPGATPANINYAIAGTVNYRTLQPTRTPQVAVDESVDTYGGVITNLRATGTVNAKLGYALDYFVDGTPGPLFNYPAQFGPIQSFFGQPTLNGQLLCGPAAPKNCLGASSAGPSNLFSGQVFSSPLSGCCTTVNSNYLARNQLAKLQYNFSPQTSLTTSFLGLQGQSSEQAAFTYNENNRVFQPAAGYTGTLPAGTKIACCATWDLPYQDVNRQDLFSVELRTTINKVTLLGRYYTASIDDLSFDLPQTSHTFNLTSLYGSAYLGKSTTPTFFNGGPATLTIPNAYFPGNELDQLQGISGEADYAVANNVYTFSYDRVHSTTSQLFDFAGVDSIGIPASSGQTFDTFRGQAVLAITPKLSANLSNYYLKITNHVSPDGGITYADYSSFFNAPRVSLIGRPSSTTSLRFAAGSSIAPPYLSLITTPTSPPQNFGGGFFYQTVNSANVKPETAFSYNVGADVRFHHDTTVSLDSYTTNVRNLLLSTTTFAGTYTPPPNSGTGNNSPGPLYISSSANLGVARYQGLELSAQHTPTEGLGGTLSFALLRAYTYHLPPGFYEAGGVPFSANIGIIPNVNYQPNSYYYSGISPGRVPYSQGYAEASYRHANRFEALMGATYYGSNNSYNYPAFVVVNASLKYNVNRDFSVQLSGNNIFGIYSSPVADLRQNGPNIQNALLANGYQGQVPGVNQGPATARLTLRYGVGR